MGLPALDILNFVRRATKAPAMGRIAGAGMSSRTRPAFGYTATKKHADLKKAYSPEIDSKTGGRRQSAMSDRLVTVQKATKGPPGERIPPPPPDFETKTAVIPKISNEEAAKKLRSGRNTISPSSQKAFVDRERATMREEEKRTVAAMHQAGFKSTPSKPTKSATWQPRKPVSSAEKTQRLPKADPYDTASLSQANEKVKQQGASARAMHAADPGLADKFALDAAKQRLATLEGNLKRGSFEWGGKIDASKQKSLHAKAKAEVERLERSVKAKSKK